MSNDCAGAAALVEKLADGEASDSEKREAERHLEKCSSCRDHLAFVTALGVCAREFPASQPPDEYWEDLSRRILVRIGSETRRGGLGRIWQALLAPGSLRWQALGAMVLVLAAVGITVHRAGDLRPERDAPAISQAAPPPEPAATLPEEKSIEPPMARDELPSEPMEPVTQKTEAEEPALAPEAPAVAIEDREEPRAFEPASRARENASGDVAALSSAIAFEDCGELRRALPVEGDDSRTADVRYRLALCSLRRYESDPRAETLELAIADAEAFLAAESESPRADEIRVKLAGIK